MARKKLPTSQKRSKIVTGKVRPVTHKDFMAIAKDKKLSKSETVDLLVQTGIKVLRGAGRG